MVRQCVTASPIATELSPYRQGDLDGLCGPYALINALRITLEPYRIISDDEARDMLHQLVEHAIANKHMADSVRNGINWPRLRKMATLLAHMASDKNHNLKLIEIVASHEADRWDTMAILIEAGSAVLFHDQTADHYTVGVGLTASRVRLFEGDGQQWLSRRGQGLHHGLAFIIELA